MRIVMTTDTIGGVWRFAMTLCRELADFEIEVTLAAFGAAPDEHQAHEAAALGNVTLRSCECKLEWMDDPWGDVERSVRWLERVVSESCPDVLHCNMYAPLMRDWVCPVALTAHSDVCTWWRSVKGKAAPARFNAYREMAARALERADVVVAPTEAYGRMLQAEFGSEAPPVTIHNGLSVEGPVHNATAPPCPRLPRLVIAGRMWDDAKNVAAAIEAVQGLPVELVVIGELGESAARELPENVIATGVMPPSAVRQWLRSAEIAMSPARYEPFGLFVLEAAAEGCALLLSDIPTFCELWDGACDFVDSNQPDEWRRAIMSLIDNDVRRADRASAAFDRSSHYSAARMAAHYARQYERLTASAPREGVNACAS